VTPLWSRVLREVEGQGRVALVSVVASGGSVPREAGARMLVRPDGGFFGTIGGGALEWRVIAEAQTMLAEPRPARLIDIPLGPDLGQCCGGRVSVLIELFAREDRAALAALGAAEAQPGGIATEAVLETGSPHLARAIIPHDPAAPALSLAKGRLRETFADQRMPVLLFGAGHVGRALVLALAPLPFRTRWVDARPDAFPPFIPDNAVPIRADPLDVLRHAPGGAIVLIMTHSHPLDLALTDLALRRADCAAVGLIGSATKRARFERRMREAGLTDETLARLVCPIGIAGIEGKEPAVIAAGVAAQMLQIRSGLARG
jgi:xanthine dehydrogenase accessory factor